MFSSAFREFESDPFFDFGNSPFNRHSFFRDEPARRHRAPAALPAGPVPAGGDADADHPMPGNSSDQPVTRRIRPADRREADAGVEAGRQLQRYEDVDRRQRREVMVRDDDWGLASMQGGFTAMERHFNQMFDGMHRMMAGMGERMRQMEAAAAREDFDGHMYSHASVYSSSGGGRDGDKPHVYQAMSETRAGPGGVRETRRAMRDSRSREERMAVGRHLGERGHVVERRRNAGTGDQQENHSVPAAGEAFDSEWQSRATALARGGGGDSGGRALPERHRMQPAIESGRRHKL